MTVDRKRLRELAMATINVLQRRRGFNGWWDGIDDETQDEILNAIVDALEAAEQPALPMDDARDAARHRFIRACCVVTLGGKLIEDDAEIDEAMKRMQRWERAAKESK